MNFFNNGILNYSGLTKSQRSNSYIEYYNRVIKLKLSKFLYGKNRCKITWPMFFCFIKNEENDKQDEINALLNKIEEKKISKKISKSYYKIPKQKIDNNNNNNLNLNKQINNLAAKIG